MKRLLVWLLCLMLPAMAHPETVLLSPPAFPEDADVLEVDFIYVNIGDCILIRCGGESMLVDGDLPKGTYFVNQYLQDAGIKEFTYYFNTHCHDDHILGLKELIKLDYMAQAYLAPYPDNYAGDAKGYQRDMRTLLAQKGIPYRQISSGDVIQLGGATLTVLRDERAGIDKNMHSAMLSVDFKGRRILLTADISNANQDYLVETFGAEALRCDILKAPHHGHTHINSLFIETANPELVVVARRQKDCEALDNQLKRRAIPALWGSRGTIRLVTDGVLWYAEQLPAPPFPWEVEQ